MKETVFEPAREIPVLKECDVVIIGGGPAGMAAAVGAARAGANAVVIERYGCMGGNLTNSSMETPNWWRDKGAAMPGGFFDELESEMIKHKAAQPSFYRPGTGLAYDTEVMKYIVDDLVVNSGATPILHCRGVSPIMRGSKVIGVVTESKSGRQAIMASRCVDCSGDGDIASRAGASYVMADEATGACKKGDLSAGTLVYGLMNVDTKRVVEDLDVDPLSRHPSINKMSYRFHKRMVADGKEVPSGIRPHYVFNMIDDTQIYALNHAWVRVDGTDVMSLTSGEMHSRKAIMEGIKCLRKYNPGMENAKLRNFAMSLGIRETRRILGEYTLTLNDVFDMRCFDDSVGIFPICLDGPEGIFPAYNNRSFQVPYRMMVPKGLENLLVAGRCVCAKRNCYGVSRLVNFAMLTGQAAGIASALSAKYNVTSRDVPIDEMQNELTRQGIKVR